MGLQLSRADFFWDYLHGIVFQVAQKATRQDAFGGEYATSARFTEILPPVHSFWSVLDCYVSNFPEVDVALWGDLWI